MGTAGAQTGSDVSRDLWGLSFPKPLLSCVAYWEQGGGLQPSLRSCWRCFVLGFQVLLLHSVSPSTLSRLPVPAAVKHPPPQHDAVTSIPHSGDAIVKVMSGAWFAPNMMPKFKGTILNLGFYPALHSKLRQVFAQIVSNIRIRHR